MSKALDKPQARQEHAGNRYTPPSRNRKVPNNKGYQNKNYFDHNIGDADVVDEFDDVDAFPPKKLPRVGQLARERRDQNSRNGPKS
jgi:hypothetical protein